MSIETALSQSNGEYLLGDFTQADIMMMAHFHRLEDVALGVILQWDKLPQIRAYWQRLQARPSYQLGILDWHEDHWRWGIQQVFAGRDSDKLPKLKRKVEKLLGDDARNACPLIRGLIAVKG